MSRFEILGMNPDDFSSKLGDSIFRVNGDVFRLHEVGGAHDREFGDEDEDCGDSVSLRGQRLSNRGGVWEDITYYPEEQDVQIDLSFPDTGYVNYKSGAVYVTRIVERQYKYGYNRRVVQIDDRFYAEREEFGNRYQTDIVLNPLFIARLFDRFFFTYEHAMALVRSKKRLGAAISKYIYIGMSGEYDKPVICYKDKVIGYVDGDVNYLFPDGAYAGVLLPSFQLLEDTSDAAIRVNWN